MTMTRCFDHCNSLLARRDTALTACGYTMTLLIQLAMNKPLTHSGDMECYDIFLSVTDRSLNARNFFFIKVNLNISLVLGL